MKESIASLLRHAVTGLAGLGGLLAAKGWISPDETAVVDAAGGSIGAALVVIGTAIVARALMMALGKILPAGAGENGTTTNDKTGLSGGVGLILTMTGAAAVLMGGLPSCSPGQLGSMPIRAKILTPQGNLVYSSKGGLEVEVDASSAK